MERLQVKYYGHNQYSKLQPDLMLTMVQNKWNNFTEDEKIPFYEKAKSLASKGETFVKPEIVVTSTQSRKRQSELEPGEVPAIDLLPLTYPIGCAGMNCETV